MINKERIRLPKINRDVVEANDEELNKALKKAKVDPDLLKLAQELLDSIKTPKNL